MKNFIVCCLISTALPAMADVVRSRIHSVEKINGKYLVKFENGRVGFSSLGVFSGTTVEAKLDHNNSVISLQSIEKPNEKIKSVTAIESREAPVYEPTILPDLNAATKIFKRLNPNYKRASECTNRAHVWAHEEYKKNNLKSMKVFVFFTASYIDRVHLKWWFHVAPMVAVKEGDKIERRVMDFMFTRQPLKVKEWTDQFVFSKRSCLPTTKFSEYDVNPQTEDCYLMDGPMYNWTPTDFHNEEMQNIYKTDFSQGEIRAAYNEAF